MVPIAIVVLFLSAFFCRREKTAFLVVMMVRALFFDDFEMVLTCPCLVLHEWDSGNYHQVPQADEQLGQ